MSENKLCIICHKKCERQGECSHIDCPVRPRCWSDLMPHSNRIGGLDPEFDAPSDAHDRFNLEGL